MTAYIRTATSSDAAHIATVHVASWRETYAGLLPETMLNALSVKERTERWARILGDASTAVFVAEHQDGVMGFASAGPQRDQALLAQGFTGEISAIYLLRRAQRRSTGRRLMATAAQSLRDRGHRAASLWVLRDSPARRFYERLGGEQFGEKEDRRDDATLVELAYGWRNLNALADL